jgi:myo-inositol-1(or 4)-monophosphatase
VLLGRYGGPVAGLARKSSATDPVSDADRAAETAIRELLAAERPEDGLLAEEGSRAEAASGRRWVVDPLDGTVNYLYGFQAEVVRRVLPRVRDIRRAGAAALDMAWLAAGRLDGYYERGLNPWDWAAGRLLVEEAGGAVADLPGQPPGLVAASPALLPALRELVA